MANIFFRYIPILDSHKTLDTLTTLDILDTLDAHKTQNMIQF